MPHARRPRRSKRRQRCVDAHGAALYQVARHHKAGAVETCSGGDAVSSGRPCAPGCRRVRTRAFACRSAAAAPGTMLLPACKACASPCPLPSLPAHHMRSGWRCIRQGAPARTLRRPPRRGERPPAAAAPARSVQQASTHSGIETCASTPAPALDTGLLCTVSSLHLCNQLDVDVLKVRGDVILVQAVVVCYVKDEPNTPAQGQGAGPGCRGVSWGAGAQAGGHPAGRCTAAGSCTRLPSAACAASRLDTVRRWRGGSGSCQFAMIWLDSGVFIGRKRPTGSPWPA